MKLNKLNLENFRNIKKLEINPCDNINVIYGENAQGKTNIIESIWLFTGNNSFRGSKLNEFISFNCDYSKLFIEFEDKKRKQKAQMIFSNKKKIKLNNVELKSQVELNGNFYAIAFSPTDLSLIKDGPKNRRRFLDIAISQINPQYKNYLNTYDKLVEQRNALLKKTNTYKNLKNDIDIWDIQLSKIGTIISIYRNDYIKKIIPITENIYSGLSSQREQFSIKYISTIYEEIENITVYDDVQVEYYYKKLKSSFETDISNGCTTCGIHRDDIEIYIDGHLVKTYGSQGQQRSSVITLKLSEAGLLKKITGENPIILLDDVMSELDEKRQDYILNHVKNMQVFITCCDVTNTIRLKKGNIFRIKNGEIIDFKKLSEN